ncbi:hypothetical protein [Ralstonia insidiosa]|uniref:hypothetical protein n=1 Tax=Ralstonia insidiosa TaxID=190721 RepID=UPI0007DBF794|nr:hypothetical protein [Ralstonia insidiosa]
MSNTTSTPKLESNAALTEQQHDVALLEAEWGAARRADYMAFLWKDAINRMTDDEKQVQLDALCWEWWARTRGTDTCKHDWDALFALLHPLYVWWREEDHARFVVWQQRKTQERGQGRPCTNSTAGSTRSIPPWWRWRGGSNRQASSACPSN